MCIDPKTDTIVLDIQKTATKVYTPVCLEPLTNVKERLGKEITQLNFFRNSVNNSEELTT